MWGVVSTFPILDSMDRNLHICGSLERFEKRLKAQLGKASVVLSTFVADQRK